MYKLEILHQCAKGLQLTVRKIWGLIPTFVEGTGEKLVGEAFFPPPPPPSVTLFNTRFQ